MPSAHLNLIADSDGGAWPWITIMDGVMDGDPAYLDIYAGDGESFTLLGADVVLTLDAPSYLNLWMDGSSFVAIGLVGATAGPVALTAGVGELIGEEFVIVGATAVTNWNAPTPSVPTVGSAAIVLYGATAALIASAPVGNAVAAPNTVVSGATAQATFQAGVGFAVPDWTIIPGDFIAAPIQIVYSGITIPNVQAFHPNLYTSTLEPGEPSPGTLAATVWYSIWSDQPLNIAVTFTGAVDAMDLFEGYPVSPTPYTGNFDVQANTLYYLRAGTDTPNGVAEFILTATPVPIAATIGMSTVDRTPTTVQVFGGGFPANSPVVVSLSGGEIATIYSDAAGVIVPTDIQIVGDLNAGTYSVTAQSGSVMAEGTFTVLNNPLPAAVTPPSDSATTIPAGSRWMLRDPYTTGHIADFVFVTNPSEMASPHAPKNITVDKTTTGVPHFWEGGLRAYEWSFSGILETEAEFNALSDYRRIGRRFHLRDHRNRVWTVTFTNLDVQPLRHYPALMGGMHVSEVLRSAPWAHKYTVSALIYAGPVDAI